MSPQARREAVEVLMTEREMGVTRACGLVGISRPVFRYEPKRTEATAPLSERLSALPAEKRRYGYRRLHVLILRQGHVVNWKRLSRLYRDAGLAVRLRSFTGEGEYGRKSYDGLKRAIPLKRLGQPEDIPGLVAFPASEDADFITGQVISVSGGLTMHG